MMAASDRAVPEVFRRGCVIPAHPLALDSSRRLDERRQRALSRYYLDAGAGGLAVGVHTTQFAIHEPGSGLLAPVLGLAAETASAHPSDPVLVAGVCGPRDQAVTEAKLAASLGYHLVLLTEQGVAEQDEDLLLERARAVGEVLPVVGFYLQRTLGGRARSRRFWCKLAALECVVGIKVAPFDRYATHDVLQGVSGSGRADQITLYTGNDDHILLDLVTPYGHDGEAAPFVGGLLGQWAVWVRRAVELLETAGAARNGDDDALRRLVTLDPQLTDANGAIFDAAGGFRGCIPGIHEVLRRHGLLTGRWCLDEDEDLSPGQLAEIDRVWNAYPHLRDDDFIAANVDRWLG